jgi:hypothetical protein
MIIRPTIELQQGGTIRVYTTPEVPNNQSIPNDYAGLVVDTTTFEDYDPLAREENGDREVNVFYATCNTLPNITYELSARCVEYPNNFDFGIGADRHLYRCRSDSVQGSALLVSVDRISWKWEELELGLFQRP